MKRYEKNSNGAAVVRRGVVRACAGVALLAFGLPFSAQADSALLGVEPIADALVYAVDPAAPLTLLLSKNRYPAEDGHLDAIVWLDGAGEARPDGTLELTLRDAAGAVLLRETIDPLPAGRVFFSLRLPEALHDSEGRLEARWHDPSGDTRGAADTAFRVAPPATPPRRGRIAIRIPNPGGVHGQTLPVTLGVPFPRGALDAPAEVRLVDAAGRAQPLQTRVTARWSRFGSVKWLHCDFTTRLEGEPRELFLEYGNRESTSAVEAAHDLAAKTPDAQRSTLDTREASPAVDVSRWASMSVDPTPAAFPPIDAGVLRIDADGLWADTQSDGQFVRVLTAEALSGAFVEHENGTVYRPDPETPFVIEDAGPEKIVVRREGWYVSVGSGQRAVGNDLADRHARLEASEEAGHNAEPAQATPDARHATPDSRFCKYVTRYVVHRNSPLVRILHTWIYTGDAHADRIRNLGWRFALDETLAPGGFLESDAAAVPTWLPGDFLLQHDFEHYQIMAAGRVAHAGGRAPGVARADSPGSTLLLGVKDFWQNYPYELEFTDGALYAHQWPRHGRPALHPARIEDGLRLWFAHEGELLDFALPREWTEDPDFYFASPARNRERYQLRQRRETVNAQGVAKTDEFWLWLGPGDDTQVAQGAGVLAGLNDNTLRAHADPAWVAASGAFYEMHPRDPERFPEEEHYFELAALAPLEWIERIRFYGKWVWGDMTWTPDLDNRGFGLYRGFRKAHQGWPYSWVPYARSGDPRLRRLADAATRRQADVIFCHYADERAPCRTGSRPRPRGFTIRYRVPWATHSVNPSSRGYIDKANYLLHAWYLTGYKRAWDVLLDWANLTKHEGWNNWGRHWNDRSNFDYPLNFGNSARGSMTLLQAYTETYEATFDPWFLAAAHQIAASQHQTFVEHGWTGHFWNSGPREFLRFSGCPRYADFYLAYANAWADSAADFTVNVRLYPMMEPAAFAWEQTGDRYYLRRVRAMVDDAIDWAYTYDGAPDWHRGRRVTGGFTHHMGYLLQYFPIALHALAGADEPVDPLPMHFYQLPGRTAAKTVERDDGKRAYALSYDLAVRKAPGEALPLTLRFEQPGLAGFRYAVHDPAGNPVATGHIADTRPEIVEIPADAPEGVYRVRIEGESRHRPDQAPRAIDGLLLPVSPPGTPEVWLLGDARETGPTGNNQGARYVFHVPADLSAFTLEFDEALNRRIPKITLRDPDGRSVKTFQGPVDLPDERSEAPLRMTVPVTTAQAGRTWQVIIAARGHGVRFDPRIPPYLSTDPQRWFNPDPETP